MMKAPGAVTNHPSEDTLPMLAITVGIMKMPARSCFRRRASLRERDRSALPRMSSPDPASLDSLDRRLRDDLLLELTGLRPEVFPQQSAEAGRCVECRERPIDQQPKIAVAPPEGDAIALAR